METKSYWEERYDKLPDYIVVSRDGDGLDYYQVVHKDDENLFYSGCFPSTITHGFSLRKSEMQELADKMNEEAKK